jgi:hypothetical protein
MKTAIETELTYRKILNIIGMTLALFGPLALWG